MTPETDGRYQSASREGVLKGDNPSIIGRGGLGVVLSVRDTHLGREVALKELRVRRPGGATTERPSTAATARFLREARVTAQLQHPSIVPVHELGRRADGTLYYTMNYVRGRTMSAALADARTLRERLALLPRFADVCHAIAYAHSRGVVHRDIKPDNVMVGEFGETIVLDWGLARVDGEGDDPEEDAISDLGDGSKTVAGAIMGTPAYMSPEQAAGGAVDRRSDTWALGVVLFQLVAGALPFAGKGKEVMQRIQNTRAPRLASVVPDAPPDLCAIADKALSKSPARRYASAQELARDLDAWLAGDRVSAYTYRKRDLFTRFVARNRAAVAVGGVAVGLLVGLGVASYQKVEAERDQALGHLADALVSKAQTAIDAGDVLSGSVYAAGALALAERPEARGQVMRLAGQWSPRLTAIRTTNTHCRGVAFAMDGALACASSGQLTVWDRGGDLRFRRGVDAISVAFDPSGQRLAVGEQEDEAKQGLTEVLDASTGALLARLPQVGTISAVRFAYGHLYTLGYDYSLGGTLVAWDPSTWSEVARRTNAPRATTIAITPEGWVAVPGGEAELSMNPLTLRPEAGPGQIAWQTVSPFTTGLQFSPDGKRVAGTNGDGTLLVADAATGALTRYPGDGGLGFAAWAPGGRLLGEGREAGALRLRDTRDFKTVARLPPDLGSLAAFAFSADGRSVATGTLAGDVRVWDVSEAGQDTLFSGGADVVTAKFLPNGRYVSIGGAGTRLWDGRTGKLACLLDDHVTVGSGVAMVGTRLAVGRGVGGVAFYDPNTCALLRVVDTAPMSGFTATTDGRSLLLVHPNDALLVDTETFVTRQRFVDPGAGFFTANQTADPDVLEMDTRAAPAYRLHVASGTIDEVPGLDTTQVYYSVISGDGRSIVSSGLDGVVRWVDLTTGQEVDRVEGATTGLAIRIGVSPDGRYLAAGGKDASINVWDVPGKRLVATLRGHRGRLQAISFSSDGLLLTDAWPATVIGWDLNLLHVPGAELLARAERRSGLRLDGASLVPLR